MLRYKNLKALLDQDDEARAIFEKIPGYAQDQIMARADHVGTTDELRAYVDNVLKGDG